MNVELKVEQVLEEEMAALQLSPRVPYPVELIGKIVSYTSDNKDAMSLLLKSHSAIRGNFSAILAGVSGTKLSAILSQLLNFATDEQWKTFFMRLKPKSSFSNIRLHLTLTKKHAQIETRLDEIQKRFSNVLGLTIKGGEFELPKIIPLCSALDALTLRDYMKLTDLEFCQIPLPTTLTRFSMSLHSLRFGSIIEMGPGAINHLFSRCQGLTHFELRDNEESQNPRHSIAKVNWPASLTCVQLPEWFFTRDELVSLLQKARLLRRLDVCLFKGEITPQQFVGFELPSTFQELLLTDEASKKRFQTQLACQRNVVLAALKKAPKFLNVLFLEADAQKNLLTRQKKLEEILAIDPTFTPALEKLTLHHYQHRDIVIGHNLVIQLAGLGPDALTFLLPLVKSYHRDNPEKAIQIAKVSVQYGSDTSSFKAYLGDLLHRGAGCAKDPALAKKLLDDAVQKSSQQIDGEAYRLARLSLAALLEQEGTNPEQVKFLRDARNWH